MNKLLLMAAMLLVCLPVWGRQRVQGWCEDGNRAAYVSQSSTSTPAVTRFQQSFPSCTVTAYSPAGSLTLATIYSDTAGTAKANPFTAASSGQWFFYIDTPTCDVKFSGGGISTPFTRGDLCNAAPTWRTENFSGATFGARASACLTALPSTGGICDGTNDTTTLTITSNPFSGITKPFKLLLGPYNYATDASLVLTNTGQEIQGTSQGATQIYASASFPVAAAITLTGCTNANPIVCTANAAHNLAVNDIVHVVGETGNTAANGPWRVVAVGGSGTTFTLEGGIGNAADTGGGTAYKVTPLIKFLNNSSPIFGGGLTTLTLGCHAGGVEGGTPIAGCGGVVAQSFQNASFLKSLYIYSPTVGIFVGNSTGQNSAGVTFDRIDTINISAGAEGIHDQAQTAILTQITPNSSTNIQGLIGIHIASGTAFVWGVGCERNTDCVLQEANSNLTGVGVTGLDHAAPAGRVTNVVRTRAGDYQLLNIVASAGTGSTPVGLKDESRSFSLAGSQTAVSAGSAYSWTMIPPFYVGSDQNDKLATTGNAIYVESQRGAAPSNARCWQFYVGSAQADANASSTLVAADTDCSTNSHEFVRYSRNNGGALAGYTVNYNPDGTGGVYFSGNVKFNAETTLRSRTNAQLGAEANGTIYYCTDCTIANPCAGGGTGAVAKKIASAWVCN